MKGKDGWDSNNVDIMKFRKRRSFQKKRKNPDYVHHTYHSIGAGTELGTTITETYYSKDMYYQDDHFMRSAASRR